MSIPSFPDAGFYVYQTGGGCTAYRLDLEADDHILITDADGCSHTVDDGGTYLIALYWADAEGNAAWSTPIEAISVAGALEATSVARLAHAFASHLSVDLGDEALAEAIATNDERGAEDPSCASHDHCDANMTMHAAWVSTFGNDPLHDTLDGMSDASCDLWCEAWAFAKQNAFFTRSA